MSDAIDLGYTARSAFRPFHARRQRWACVVAHRRAGKSVACVMDLVDSALRFQASDGRFAYVAPTYAQVKDVAWLYLKRFTAPIPGIRISEAELSVTLPNEARIRLYGAEAYDRLRGLYLDGVVIDEYADIDRRAWGEVIRPALADREGWAVFLGTPKGRDDFWRVWQDAKAAPERWYQTILRASETGILPPDELAGIRADLTAEAYAQEMECDFATPVQGAVFGAELDAAERAGRITRVPYEQGGSPVMAVFDLGWSDHTSIWFVQKFGFEWHVIDYYENRLRDLDHYVTHVQSRGYVVGQWVLPHDGDAATSASGKANTVAAQLRRRGLQVRVLPRLPIADSIAATRSLFPRLWFDEAKCDHGLEMLRRYRYAADVTTGRWSREPIHDEASHAGSALRYVAMAATDAKPKQRDVPEFEFSAASPGVGWMS